MLSLVLASVLWSSVNGGAWMEERAFRTVQQCRTQVAQVMRATTGVNVDAVNPYWRQVELVLKRPQGAERIRLQCLPGGQAPTSLDKERV